MNFSNKEQKVIHQLSKRKDEVLYFKDFAPFFISKSCLQLSTYTQTLYVYLPEHGNWQAALSEYFQLVVFLKKLEQSAYGFSIPYTPLEDNTIYVGEENFRQEAPKTIADADLIIQLQHYAGKKYMLQALPKKVFGLSLPTFLGQMLLVLAFVLALSSYYYVEMKKLAQQQHAQQQQMEQMNMQQEQRFDEVNRLLSVVEQQQEALQHHHSQLESDFQQQQKSLQSIRYWNVKQAQALDRVVEQLNALRQEE